MENVRKKLIYLEAFFVYYVSYETRVYLSAQVLLYEKTYCLPDTHVSCCVVSSSGNFNGTQIQ